MLLLSQLRINRNIMEFKVYRRITMSEFEVGINRNIMEFKAL